MKGLIHLYCGDGKGKTSAAIGLIIRALGSGMKVVFTQFLKDNKSSEIEVLKNLSRFEFIYCKKSFGFFWNMSEDEKIEAKEIYNDLLRTAIEGSKDANVLVLDEIIGAFNHGLIEQDFFIDFLKNKPDSLEIVLTGRNPSEEIIEIADYVSNIQKVKHPFDNGINARIGIEK